MKYFFYRLLFLVFFLTNYTIFAQLVDKYNDITKNAIGYFGIASIDLDGDGDREIIGSSKDNKLFWHDNLGGNNFSEQRIIDQTEAFFSMPIVDDFDNDGDQDIFVITRTQYLLYENVGLGSALIKHSSPSSLNFTLPTTLNIKSIDVDEDNDLDIAVTLRSSITSEGKVLWIKNNGIDNFVFGAQIHTGIRPLELQIIDVDGDGRDDITYSLREGNTGGQVINKIIIKRNLANSNFSTAYTFQNTLGDSQAYLRFQFIDMDMDGDIDLTTKVSGQLQVIKQQGNFIFNSPINIENNGAIINGSPLEFGYINDDDTLDLVLYTGVLFSVHIVYNIMNDSNQNQSIFVSPGSESYIPFRALVLNDLDENGDSEILISYCSGEYVTINPTIDSSGVFDFQYDKYNSSLEENYRYSRFIDQNNNGRESVFYSKMSGGYPNYSLGFYSQDGNNLRYKIDPDEYEYSPIESIDVADVNNDGIEDPIIENNGHISWLEINENNESIIHEIGYGYLQGSLFTKRFDFGDFDNDGDLDLVLIENSNNKIIVFKNEGDGLIWNEVDLDYEPYLEFNTLFVDDIDNDGVDEIICSLESNSPFGGNELIWFDCTAFGYFTAYEVIINDLGAMKSAHVVDLNNDGLNDLVFAEKLYYNETIELYWLKGLSLGGFSVRNFIDDSLSSYNIEIFDNDLDGDIDVYAQSIKEGMNAINVYNNNGLGIFDEPEKICKGIGDNLRFDKGDIDNDGDMDLLTNSYWLRKLAWVENKKNGISYNNLIACDSFIMPSGDSVVFESGYYTDTLVSSYLGDSIIVIDLVIQGESYFEYIDTICDNQDYYFGDNLISFSGVYFDSLTNICGYDSIVSLYIEVLPTYLTTIDTIICYGDIFQIETALFSESGIYSEVLESTMGCDSIVNLDLTVEGNNDTILFLYSCDSIVFSNLPTIFETGIYYDSLISTNNCDSVIILDVIISGASSEVIDTIICKGNVLNYEGNTYVNEDNYTVSLTNQYGCDSIIELYLWLNGEEELQIDTFICYTQSIQIGGNIYDSTGIFTDTLINSCGFDSVINLNLFVPQIEEEYFFDSTICFGNEIEFDGQILDSTYYYEFNYINQFGCDSIIYYDLVEIENTDRFIDSFICNSESIVINGNLYSIPGEYEFTDTDIYGCDSVTTILFESFDLSINQNSTFLVSSQTDVEFQWLRCPDYDLVVGEISHSFEPIVNGYYALEITNSSCKDTTECIPFFSVNIDEISNSIISIFPNPFLEYINIITITENLIKVVVYDVNGKEVIQKNNLNNSQLTLNTSKLNNGIYSITIYTNTHIRTYKLVK